jgi:AAA15 family ATPase/GTPase
MLIQFRVGNYRSFGSEVTLSMEAVKAFKEHEENVIKAEHYRLLRSSAIYGANASGKTNFGKALDFMRDLVLSSASRNSVAEISTEPFRLDKKNLIKPSLFEVVFLLDSFTYRYGFEVTGERVNSEWLFRTQGSSRNVKSPLFTRILDKIEVSEDFKEGLGYEPKTRGNALFLSTVDQQNGAISHTIIKWFNAVKILSGMRDEAYERFTLKQMEDPVKRQRIIDFVRQVDDSILNITIDKVFDPLLQTASTDFTIIRAQVDGSIPCGEVGFSLASDESAGTRKILRLAGPWLEMLDQGNIAFVDELEARLHPHLTRRLVRLFNSPETNPRNVQLIFVTHDTNLLTYGGLRRDQVWFCEKAPSGATDLYSLAEIKVRKGAKFENEYIAGKYGAIPYFGNIHDVGGVI